MLKKTTTIIFIINLLFCNSNNNKLSERDKKVISLNEEIKTRTKNDLKKYGIKKILLYGNGKWISSASGYLYFRENGTILNDYKGEKRTFLWKVLKDKLYINLNYSKQNKFYLMNAVPAEGSGYSNIKDLENFKYSLTLESKLKENKDNHKLYFYIHCYK